MMRTREQSGDDGSRKRRKKTTFTMWRFGRLWRKLNSRGWTLRSSPKGSLAIWNWVRPDFNGQPLAAAAIGVDRFESQEKLFDFASVRGWVSDDSGDEPEAKPKHKRQEPLSGKRKDSAAKKKKSSHSGTSRSERKEARRSVKKEDSGSDEEPGPQNRSNQPRKKSGQFSSKVAKSGGRKSGQLKAAKKEDGLVHEMQRLADFVDSEKNPDEELLLDKWQISHVDDGLVYMPPTERVSLPSHQAVVHFLRKKQAYEIRVGSTVDAEAHAFGRAFAAQSLNRVYRGKVIRRVFASGKVMRRDDDEEAVWRVRYEDITLDTSACHLRLVIEEQEEEEEPLLCLEVMAGGVVYERRGRDFAGRWKRYVMARMAIGGALLPGAPFSGRATAENAVRRQQARAGCLVCGSNDCSLVTCAAPSARCGGRVHRRCAGLPPVGDVDPDFWCPLDALGCPAAHLSALPDQRSMQSDAAAVAGLMALGGLDDDERSTAAHEEEVVVGEEAPAVDVECRRSMQSDDVAHGEEEVVGEEEAPAVDVECALQSDDAAEEEKAAVESGVECQTRSTDDAAREEEEAPDADVECALQSDGAGAVESDAESVASWWWSSSDESSSDASSSESADEGYSQRRLLVRRVNALGPEEHARYGSLVVVGKWPGMLLDPRVVCRDNDVLAQQMLEKMGNNKMPGLVRFLKTPQKKGYGVVVDRAYEEWSSEMSRNVEVHWRSKNKLAEWRVACATANELSECATNADRLIRVLRDEGTTLKPLALLPKKKKKGPTRSGANKRWADRRKLIRNQRVYIPAPEKEAVEGAAVPLVGRLLLVTEGELGKTKKKKNMVLLRCVNAVERDGLRCLCVAAEGDEVHSVPFDVARRGVRRKEAAEEAAVLARLYTSSSRRPLMTPSERRKAHSEDTLGRLLADQRQQTPLFSSPKKKKSPKRPRNRFDLSPSPPPPVKENIEPPVKPGSSCMICVDLIEGGGTTLGCGHAYHVTCLQELAEHDRLATHTRRTALCKCPLCRTTIRHDIDAKHDALEY